MNSFKQGVYGPGEGRDRSRGPSRSHHRRNSRARKPHETSEEKRARREKGDSDQLAEEARLRKEADHKREAEEAARKVKEDRDKAEKDQAAAAAAGEEAARQEEEAREKGHQEIIARKAEAIRKAQDRVDLLDARLASQRSRLTELELNLEAEENARTEERHGCERMQEEFEGTNQPSLIHFLVLQGDNAQYKGKSGRKES